jgi:hypothetical protein
MIPRAKPVPPLLPIPLPGIIMLYEGWKKQVNVSLTDSGSVLKSNNTAMGILDRMSISVYFQLESVKLVDHFTFTL